MRKKILFVVTKSNFGGAQRYVYDLATNLPHSFEPVVVCGPGPDGNPGRLVSLLAKANVRTILLSELTRDMHLKNDLAAYRALKDVFARENPDIVHLNSSKAGGLGALAARRAKIAKIVFTSHGLAFDEKRPLHERASIFFATWATMLLSHKTIVISTDTLDRVRRLPFLTHRIRLIYNGIHTPRFLSKEAARKEISALDPYIPLNAKWIGSIGELHPNKHFSGAIDALTLISQSDAHLILIGEGEERERLQMYAKKRGVSDRVHFLGFIPDAAHYLRAFDVFLLSSRKEGLPYVLLEAGFAYLPVVASDIAGSRDIILHNFTGLIYPPEDAHAAAAALERILSDATLARSLADELLKRVQKTFSLEGMLEKTVRLYTQ